MTSSSGGMPRLAPWLIAVACGVVVANIYYSQPLSGVIGASLEMPRESLGLLVTLPQIGYGVGLLALVPLGDLLENRKLVLSLLAAECACLLGAAAVHSAVPFLMAAFCIGATAVAVQVLVPYATYIAPEAERGRMVGRVMSGLMLGIMLSRPAASLIADRGSWRDVFVASAVLTALLMAVMPLVLPKRRPAPGISYGALLGSLGRIWINTPILRRRALYHASMFGAFTVFWTAVPLWLTSSRFALTQQGVAWVALAGVAGAVAPPFAGRLADRGWTRPATAGAMLLAIASYLVSVLAALFATGRVALGLIVATAVALDFAVSGNMVLGQREIFALDAAQRSRLNGLYIATFFIGGAIASGLAGFCYARFGWLGVAALGAALPLLALLYFMGESGAVGSMRRAAGGRSAS